MSDTPQTANIRMPPKPKRYSESVKTSDVKVPKPGAPSPLNVLRARVSNYK